MPLDECLSLAGSPSRILRTPLHVSPSRRVGGICVKSSLELVHPSRLRAYDHGTPSLWYQPNPSSPTLICGERPIAIVERS